MQGAADAVRGSCLSRPFTVSEAAYQMNPLERLQQVTLLAQQQQDLPDFIAQRITDLVAELQSRPLPGEAIEELIEQVSLYDTYGQTGYLGMGVNHVILTRTIDRIVARL